MIVQGQQKTRFDKSQSGSFILGKQVICLLRRSAPDKTLKITALSVQAAFF